MITLALEFKDGSGGYSQSPLNYKQVARQGNFAIYQRFYVDGHPKDFEVIKIKVLPKGTSQKFPNGNVKVTEDDEEKYPTTSSWGKMGWTFGNLTAAQGKMETLLNNHEEDTEENDSVKTDVVVDGTTYFTIKQYSEQHNIPYVNANLLIKEMLEKGSVKFVGEKHLNAKGKASKIYTKTT